MNKKLSLILAAAVLFGSIGAEALAESTAAGLSGFRSDSYRVIEASKEETVKQCRITYSPDSTELLEIEASVIKDLDQDGELDVYEDWRKSTDRRATDLLGKLTAEEKVSLLFAADITGFPAEIDPVSGFEPAADNSDLRLITEHGITAFRTGTDAPDAAMTAYCNALQACAEATNRGIPVTVMYTAAGRGVSLNTEVLEEATADALQHIIDRDADHAGDPVQALVSAVKSGDCDEALLNGAALSVIKSKLESGLFEEPYTELP